MVVVAGGRWQWHWPGQHPRQHPGEAVLMLAGAAFSSTSGRGQWRQLEIGAFGHVLCGTCPRTSERSC